MLDPLFILRTKHKTILSPKTTQLFLNEGFEKLTNDIYSIDLHFATNNLLDATNTVLSLYGFVMVEEFWEATFSPVPSIPPINRTRFNHPDEFKTGLTLPFNNYALIKRFSRGLDEIVLTVHHLNLTQVKENTYHARTLIGNTKLLEDLKTITYTQLKMSIPPQARDPLGIAFDEGYTIDIENGQYAYHLRVLVEVLADKLNDPEHVYFFNKGLSRNVKPLPPPDLQDLLIKTEKEILKAETNQTHHYRDKTTAKCIYSIPINLERGSVNVDVTPYVKILETPNSKRIAGVKSLGNLNNVWHAYANQTRLEHSIGVLHFAKAICAATGIKGKDKLLIELYGLTHDWGHLTGSHATEFYFKTKNGFDHEEFAIELLEKDKTIFNEIIDLNNLIAMFRQENPLHDIIDGPFGADRIYFTSIDPSMCGEKSTFDPFSIIPHMIWKNDKLLIDQREDLAFEFLNNRAQLYETLYFSPTNQLADAYLRKLFHAAQIKSHKEKLFLENKGGYNIVEESGEFIEFWKLNDFMMQYYLSNHSNRNVSEPMRHLLVTYHKFPFATAAVIKNKGYEDSEPRTEIPLFSELKMGEILPQIESADPNRLSEYIKKIYHPDNVTLLEEEIARRMNIPARYVIVAGVPSLKKLASEYAPVRKGSKIKSIFEWNPEYQKPFLERAERMACLRVAVHPQIYPLAYDFFSKNKITDIANEILL